MSYRTFKRLLGETSLERKCRFLFGGGLLILITLSFYLYGKLTSGLVDEQNRITGRLLVMPIILKKHWEWSEARNVENDFVHMIDAMSKDLQPRDLAGYRWDLLKSTSDDPAKGPSDDGDYKALRRIDEGKGRMVANHGQFRE